MSFGFTRLLNGLKLEGQSTIAPSEAGDVRYNSGSDNLEYYNTGIRIVANLDESQTLTNKSISGASNTLSNIAYSSLILANSIVNSDINSSAAISYSKLNLSNSILNSDINASAAIAYSKLNLSNSIVNADINASAAISYSKLNLTNSIVNADIAAGAAIAYSKLSLSNSIVNSDINSTAAIARNKLASGSANQVIINDGSGVLSSEATLAKSRGGSGQDNSSLNFPASGTLATLAGSEVFTNKDIDGGTASNTDRITVPKNTTTNLNALTRKQGTILYDTTANALKYDDGSALNTLSTATILSSSSDVQNGSIVASVSGGVITIALKTLAGADPSAGDPVKVAFKTAASFQENGTSSVTGSYIVRNITSALSMTISNGSTLGLTTNTREHIYVYLIDNSGTVEFAVTATPDIFSESTLISTTAEGGVGTATDLLSIYSTTARSNVSCRIIGRITAIMIASVWNSITQIQLLPLGAAKKVLSSASSGAFSTASTSFVDVTNLTITANFRNEVPIRMAIEPFPGADSSISAGGSGGTYDLQFLLDGNVIASFSQITSGIFLPPSIFSYTIPSFSLNQKYNASASIFKVQVKNVTSSSVSLLSCRLVLYQV